MPSDPITVLVVDDEPAVLAITARALEEEGLRVIAAHSAREALAVLQRADPFIDVLLSDLVMPGMDGVQLALAAERLAVPPHVLLISGYGSVNAADEVRWPLFVKPY